MTPNPRKAPRKTSRFRPPTPHETSYQFIQTDEALRAYLRSVQSAEWLAIDTEFISEGRHSAELCLVQAATFAGPVLIDPLAIRDMTPFWEFLCSGILVIAHSCRSELEFCARAIGRLPKRLYDVQLAAGFVAEDYPLSFKRITDIFLRLDLPKGETRSDWHHRPLSLLQVEYALNDVHYLHDLAELLTNKMLRLGRYDWFLEETSSYLNRLTETFGDNRWTRLGGITSMTPLELAVVRELWRWREKKAETLNRPTARILRDDLIVELVRCKTADPERIALLRGIAKRNDLAMLLEELPVVIRRAMSLPYSQLPEPPVRENIPHYSVAVQFLMTVLLNRTQQQRIALNLLASAQDVREFLAFRQGTLPAGITARLDTGWRKIFLNGLLDSVLNGHVALKISDFTKTDPLDTVEL